MVTTPGSKGIPQIIGDPAPTLRADYNAMYAWLRDNVETSVSSTANLPSTDNWVGRTRYVTADDTIWVWDGSWRLVTTTVPLSYTPNWIGLIEGNGSNIGRYTVSGGRCFVTLVFTFGSTSSVAGNVTVQLPPLTASSIYSGTTKQTAIGTARFQDTSSDGYQGVVNLFGNNLAYADVSRLINANDRIITAGLNSSGVAWTSGDSFSATFDYILA